jgi:phosphatidylglycerophosphatase A
MPSSDPSIDTVLEHSGAEAPRPYRPTVRFMLAHPAHYVALGFGSGLSRFAPGTAGTLWAWFAFFVWQLYVPPQHFELWTGIAILVSTLTGWWACTVTAKNLRVADPGNIVWDEVVAFWLVLWLIAPTGFWGQLIAFALFRYFDAAKPGPVGWADSVFKGFNARGGFGILFDDFVAAFCTLLVIAVWRHVT